ncbi:protocadherin gamma-A3-like [Salminus brasiliensis]|uniref:protocadherin gamma-A3-like n=1 Tax=Salminus brasiliensis TaxID=930266 RepID=UPI003B830AF1
MCSLDITVSGIVIESMLSLGRSGFSFRLQVQALTLLLAADVILGQIRYSIPEELKIGSFVGNVAEDLGLDAHRMKMSGARIVSNDNNEFITLDLDKGFLLVRERIDREQLCGQTSPCSLSLEIIVTNQMQLHSVVLEILDVNDNAPSFTEKEIQLEVSESVQPGTHILQESAVDHDVGKNSLQGYTLHPTDKFNVKMQSGPDGSKYAELYLHAPLDREKEDSLLLTLTAFDGGEPQSKTVTLKISDVNDNNPMFEEQFYSAFVMENNAPGASIFSVKAKDVDCNQNARISYLLIDGQFNGEPVSSYVSVDVESGIIYSRRSFDYEQTKTLEFLVKAQDGGSPSLSSNATVKLNIQDENDNAPQILFPVQSGGFAVAEMVPRSAEVGYLVTKVVAVDVDSGQNSWLSYKLQKATDRSLFEVGLQNGEIRTVRQVIDKDAVKQKLTVVVEDNGQPSRSATVNLNVAVADSFPDVLSEFTDFTHDKDYNDNLTFYLVLALAVVSFLFIVSIIVILSVKCYRWRRERMFYKSGANLPVIPYYPPLYADVGGTGTLQHVYNYEVCRTTDSRKSDLKYARPSSESINSLDTSGTHTLTSAHRDKQVHDGSSYQVVIVNLEE